jgi:site-specific recombinase XerD
MSTNRADFESSLNRFIQYLELELGRSANTAKAYRQDLENLIDFARSRECNELTDVGIM